MQKLIILTLCNSKTYIVSNFVLFLFYLHGYIFNSFQAEADLRVAQAEFDKQVEITKLLLEGIQTAHVSLIFWVIFG
jgi:hypothetical protein